MDTGNEVKGKNRIDIALLNYDLAVSLGRRKMNAYLLPTNSYLSLYLDKIYGIRREGGRIIVSRGDLGRK
jgi:hypothetical protein